MRKGHFCLLLIATAIIAIITVRDWWKTEKKPVRTNSHKKNRNEQSAHYVPEASRFFSCHNYRITLLLRNSIFTHINDWSANIYLYRSLYTCKFLELVRDNWKPKQSGLKCVWVGKICKSCKPAVCSFMKKWTHSFTIV